MMTDGCERHDVPPAHIVCYIQHDTGPSPFGTPDPPAVFATAHDFTIAAVPQISCQLCH